MAKTKISEFSSTAGNNTDIDSINIAEGCAPSGINNAIRELMAQLKDFQTGAAGDSFNGPVGTTTAAAGAFTNLTASGTLGVTGATTLSAALTYGGVTLSNAVTGTGNMVLSTSPTLVTPALGTPSSATLTNATGLPISTGVSGLGTGVATFLGTPSSANLAAAVTDETGSGALVFATSPTLVTPALGTPSSATLTNATGLPLTTGVTGTLPTANGGTNLTSFTANGVVYASSSSALATGSALTFDGTNLSATGTTTVNSANSTQVALVVKGETGNGIRQNFIGQTSSGQYNWQIGASITAAGNFAIIPSTAVDGTTFSTAAYAITGTGTSIWSVAGSEQMRLTSTGLGIGTSSPREKLDVAGNIAAPFSDNSTIQFQYLTGSSYGLGMMADATNRGLKLFTRSADGVGYISFSTGGMTERMRLDYSGNLGLGVTPSAWSLSGLQAMQIKNASLAGYQNNAYLSANAYFSGGWRYVATDVATQYIQSSGQHQFFTAASGTAGDAISFTQALSLTAAGNLLLGGTTDPGGTKVLYIGNGTTPGTPTSGGVLYVESGALKYKGSSGTVTTLGAA